MTSQSATDLSRRFTHDTRGVIAVLTALMLIPIIGAVGLAVHYAEAVSLRSRVQAVLDQSVLAAGRTLVVTQNKDTALEALGRYFEENLGNVEGVRLTKQKADKGQFRVEASAGGTVATPLLGILGLGAFDVSANSAAAIDEVELEVALTLDLSSSMTGSRFTDLKAAATDLVEIIDPTRDKPFRRRIALAPFASAVNVGPYFDDVTDKSGANTCVAERHGNEMLTDAKPRSGAYFEPHINDSEWPCIASAISPLSSDRDGVLQAVADLRLSQGTAGHLGTAWGWYMLSPEFDGIFKGDAKPGKYGNKKISKALVIMTDGEFYKDYVGTMHSEKQTTTLCANMKAKGVAVYTVGFKMDDDSAIQMLAACASSPTHAYLAEDSNALRQSFRDIAEKLIPLKLTD
ncbi:MAG: pilus assembly protein [Pseudomonadota bacterium]